MSNRRMSRHERFEFALLCLKGQLGTDNPFPLDPNTEAFQESKERGWIDKDGFMTAIGEEALHRSAQARTRAYLRRLTEDEEQ